MPCDHNGGGCRRRGPLTRSRPVGQRRQILRGEMAGQIVQRCVQMHGGIGVTWEHDLHLYLRRVTLYRAMFGTPEEHNLRVYEAARAAR